MWFLGAVIGLLLGALFESFGLAVIFAILGAWLTHFLRHDSTNPADNLAHHESLNELQQRLSGSEIRLLRQIQVLQQRVDGLEATLKTVTQVLAQHGLTLPVAPIPPSQATNQSAPTPPTVRTPAIAEPVVYQPAQPAMPAMAEKRQAAAAPPKPTPESQPDSVAKPAPKPAAKPVTSAPPAWQSWLRQLNPFVGFGALLLFLGFAFLLRYSAQFIEIPLSWRYVGIAGAALALLGLGWRLRATRPNYALTIQGAGLGLFYLTLLAAVKLHQLLSPELGFALLFLVAVACAGLAVAQNALALAVCAALEGFATPVLTSTGGNHPLGLFTYLAILDIGILLIAHYKAWRVLNMIGLFGTLGLASAWGAAHYTPAQWATVQPFLIFFHVLFASIGLMFARRTLAASADGEEGGDIWSKNKSSLKEQAGRALARVGHVDSSLVFGTPVSAFALQYWLVEHFANGAAWSALGFAAFYAVLGYWVRRLREPGLALLAEAHLILAAIFFTLAIPLGLEGTWTGAAWAIQAVGMYWLGQRQARVYPRLGALLVLLGAAGRLLLELKFNLTGQGVFLKGSSLGSLVLAASTASIYVLQQRAAAAGQQQHAWEQGSAQSLPWLLTFSLVSLPWLWWERAGASAGTAIIALATLGIAYRFLRPAFIYPACASMALALLTARLGVAWLESALIALASFGFAYLLRQKLAALKLIAFKRIGLFIFALAYIFWFDAWATLAWQQVQHRSLVAYFPHLLLAIFVASLYLARQVAVRCAWSDLGNSTLLLLPGLAAFLGYAHASDPLLYDPASYAGWLIWPAAAVLYYWQLRQWPVQWSGIALHPYLHVFGLWLFTLVVSQELRVILANVEVQSIDAANSWADVGFILPSLLGLWLLAGNRLSRYWPFTVHLTLYRHRGAAGLAVLVWGWLLYGCTLAPSSVPLPYLPLLNPVELTQIAGFWLLWQWWQSTRWQASTPNFSLMLGFALTGLFALTAAVFRACQHWADLPWELHAFWQSRLAQAALSLVWGSAGMALMVLANRYLSRRIWFAGASLLALVVLKLFLVELSGHSNLYRIISFIGVGVLFLLVGYFAPLPKAGNKA